MAELVVEAHALACTGAVAVAAVGVPVAAQPALLDLTPPPAQTWFLQLDIKLTTMEFTPLPQILFPISVRNTGQGNNNVIVKICSTTLEQVTSSDHATLIDTGASHHCVNNKKYFIAS